MNKITYLTFLCFFIASCSSLKEKAGLVKYQPDEYQVVTNAPLTVPPDFNVHSPEELMAKRAVSDDAHDSSNLSEGENLILQNIKQ